MIAFPREIDWKKRGQPVLEWNLISKVNSPLIDSPPLHNK